MYTVYLSLGMGVWWSIRPVILSLRSGRLVLRAFIPTLILGFVGVSKALMLYFGLARDLWWVVFIPVVVMMVYYVRHVRSIVVQTEQVVGGSLCPTELAITVALAFLGLALFMAATMQI